MDYFSHHPVPVSNNVLSGSTPSSDEQSVSNLVQSPNESPYFNSSYIQNLNLDAVVDNEPSYVSESSPAVWNILPSYQMFQSIVSKNVTPSADDSNIAPPEYSNPSSSSSVSGDVFGPSMDPMTSWEESILGNTHRMPHLVNEDLVVDVKLTKTICEIGVNPVFEDVKEYTSGDIITGYITITNNSTVPIPFEMFFCTLEGRITVMNVEHTKPLIVHKFLNMTDFNASWSYGGVERVPGEGFTFGIPDPTDDTIVGLPEDQNLQPGITYKKFFLFKLPLRLLDCSCFHNSPTHWSAPPSFGINKDEFLLRLKKLKSERKYYERLSGEFLRDMCMSDCSVSYSVDSRIVIKDAGALKNANTFAILNGTSHFFRMIPKYPKYENDPRNFKSMTSEAFQSLEELYQRVEETIRVGKSAISGEVIRNDINRQNDSNKSLSSDKWEPFHPDLVFSPGGSISSQSSNSSLGEFLQSSVTIKKKLLTSSKNIGTLTIRAPSKELTMKYMTSEKYNGPKSRLRKYDPILVDLNMKFMSSIRGQKPPEIKSITAELIVFTLKSKYAVPITLSLPLIQRLESIQKKSREYLTELKAISDSGKYTVPATLVYDIKSVISINYKYNNLRIFENKNMKRLNWAVDSMEADSGMSSYTIDTQLQFDISEFHEALVPSFQTCLLTRSYWMKISVKLSNNEVCNLDLPLFVDH